MCACMPGLCAVWLWELSHLWIDTCQFIVCCVSSCSDADRLVLRPTVNCSLHEKECIAPPGSSRKNHNFDQTALTILIWQNGFSCLPRETHCMWSVKKTSADPLASSAPIEVGQNTVSLHAHTRA